MIFLVVIIGVDGEVMVYDVLLKIFGLVCVIGFCDLIKYLFVVVLIGFDVWDCLFVGF